MKPDKKILSKHHSSHLFWDVIKECIELEAHFEFVVKKVIGYGMMSNWKRLIQDLGLKKVKDISLNIRDFDHKSLRFIVYFANKDKKSYKSFDNIKLNWKHWVY